MVVAVNHGSDKNVGSHGNLFWIFACIINQIFASRKSQIA